jgi:type II secretory pathway pseudopilin PulG
MRHRPINLKRQRGFSLLEITVTSVVILASIAVVWSLAAQTRGGQDTEAYVAHVLMLQSAVQKARPHGDYTGLSQDDLVNLSLIPANYVRPGTTTVVDPSGTQLEYFAVQTPNGRPASTAVAIGYRNLTRQLCGDLSRRLAGVVAYRLRTETPNAAGEIYHEHTTAPVEMDSATIAQRCTHDAGRLRIWMR